MNRIRTLQYKDKAYMARNARSLPFSCKSEIGKQENCIEGIFRDYLEYSMM